nr:type II toxin-antitoxin system VapC family toxin [Pedobacter sp. HDW13]
MVDTSILIDYFRKKTNQKQGYLLYLNSMKTCAFQALQNLKFTWELRANSIFFWETMLSNFIIFPFDNDAALAAVEIQSNLKKVRKSIDKADLFIAATAIAHNLYFDMLNHKHFENIENVKLIGN